jgi:hypothetical protein
VSRYGVLSVSQCRDERVFRWARAVEVSLACGMARRLVQTRSWFLARPSLQNPADVRMGVDIDRVVVAWEMRH